jgi:hypothetical protein
MLVVLALAARAQSIKTHTEKNVDLTLYETFMVVKGESLTPADERRTSEKTLYEAIRKAVRQQMEERGYKYQDSTAQLVVSYVAGAYNFTDAGNTGPLGQTPASDPSQLNQSRAWSNTSREGMLVLDITDAATKKQLWKAEANDLALTNVDLVHALDAVVYKAFRKFPNKLKNNKKRK